MIRDYSNYDYYFFPSPLSFAFHNYPLIFIRNQFYENYL